MVAGPLFGERVTRHEVLWSAAAIVGVVVAVVGSSGTPVWSLRGDLLAGGSVLVWTAYFLLSKRVRARVPAMEYMTSVTVVAALTVTPLAFLSGAALGHVRPVDWALLLVFVAVAQGGHLLVAWAHAQVDVSVSSLFLLAQPIISAVAALVILSEPLTWLQATGGLVVIGSVGAVLRRATRAGGGEAVATSETAPA